MYKILLIIPMLFLVGCATTEPVSKTSNVPIGTKPVSKTVEVSKDVILLPIRTVTFIGENGKKTVVNYYGTLEELNKNNTSDEVILYDWSF